LEEYLFPDNYKILTQIAYASLYKWGYEKKWLIEKDELNKPYILDFLICNKDFTPLYAIELDESRHRIDEETKKEDGLKDAFFKALKDDAKRDGRLFDFCRIRYDGKVENELSLQNGSFFKQFEKILQYILPEKTCNNCRTEKNIKINEKGNLFWECPNSKKDKVCKEQAKDLPKWSSIINIQ